MTSKHSRFASVQLGGTYKNPLEEVDFEQVAEKMYHILSQPYPGTRAPENFRYAGIWQFAFNKLRNKNNCLPLGYYLPIICVHPDKSRFGNDRSLAHQQFLVCKKKPGHPLQWIGMAFGPTPENSTFLPRPAHMNLREFSRHVIMMLQNEEGFQFAAGRLTYDAERVPLLLEKARSRIIEVMNGKKRFALAKMGHPLDIEDDGNQIDNLAREAHTSPITGKVDPLFLLGQALGAKKPPADELPTFQVPQLTTRTHRRVRNTVSENDSFGKEQWRAAMARHFHEVFPGGVSSLPEDERMVLCFPGAGGKESEFWLAQGFEEHNLVMVEKDPRLAQELRTKYPAAHVIIKDVGNSEKAFGLSQEIRQLFFHGGEKFAVFSFDPEGALTANFELEIDNTFNNARYGDFFFSGNFNLKREQKEALQYYAEVISHRNPCDKVEASHEIRQQVAASLPAALSQRRVSTKYIEEWHGNYEGDSEATRMYWVMAKFHKEHPLRKHQQA